MLRKLDYRLKVWLAGAIALMAVLVYTHVLGIGDAGQLLEDIFTLLILFFVA